MSSDKSKIKLILMDVEGTTTSISFVHDQLFPYSRHKMESFFQEHQNDAEVSLLAEKLLTELALLPGTEVTRATLPETLIQWIDQDKKHPLLKSIQGKIWRKGYEAGEIKGHVYSDVPEAFERWSKQGLILGIYSSGSVEAQKLLFKYSVYGDLTVHLSHYFDLAVGGKREASSYLAIAKSLRLEPQEILFLSDIKEELEAAKLAGMSVIQLLRTHATQISAFKSCSSFNDIMSE